jgi:glycosyltransferase involved in cell wall biosynthesis
MTPPTPAGALPGLSVVLPCFDEQANVAAAVRQAAEAAARVSDAYEVIVVDDGSGDGTLAEAARLVGASPRVRLVVHPYTLGRGAAERSGIAVARMPWVLLLDVDLRLDLRELERFARLAGSADLIAGRRDPLRRHIRDTAWSRVVRRLFRLPVRDVECALTLVRRDLLERISLRSDRAPIGAELLVRCRAAGARVLEQDVGQRPRGFARPGAPPAHPARRARVARGS